MKQKTLFLISLGCAYLLAFSCSNNEKPQNRRGKRSPTSENSEKNPGDGASGSLTVTYEDQVAPLLTRSCLGGGCHSSPNPADGIALDTYEGAMGAFDKSLASIENGSMPPSGPLTPDDIQILKDWKNGGFLKAATEATPPASKDPPAPSPSTPSLTYTADIAPLIKNSCLGSNCHSGSDPAHNIALDSLEDLKDNFKKSLDSIRDGSMPEGRPELTDDQVKLLDDWKAAGYPE
jgi:hypothetical protein